MTAGHPLHGLEDEDLNMVVAFVLGSGSIKDLAQDYGVSYPTMRQRLDGLIERLRGRMAGRTPDPLGDYLADLLGKGQLTSQAANRIRQLHREALQARDRAPAPTMQRMPGDSEECND